MKINYVALYRKYHYFSHAFADIFHFLSTLSVCKNTLTGSFALHCDCGLNSTCLSIGQSLPLRPLVTHRHRCPSFSKCRHSCNTPTFTSPLYCHSFNGRWFWILTMLFSLNESRSQAFIHCKFLTFVWATTDADWFRSFLPAAQHRGNLRGSKNKNKSMWYLQGNKRRLTCGYGDDHFISWVCWRKKNNNSSLLVMVFIFFISGFIKRRNSTRLHQRNNPYLQEILQSYTQKLKGMRANTTVLAFADCYAIMIRFAKTNM